AEFRCEYCLFEEDDAGFPHQVEHIISRKHGGKSTLDNLAYACILCNRFKGTDVASIDSVSNTFARLFHPRQDRWSDHFRMAFFLIDPLTPTGRVTVSLLRMNDADRVVERTQFR